MSDHKAVAASSGVTLDSKGHRYSLPEGQGQAARPVAISVSSVIKRSGMIDTTWFTAQGAENGTRRHQVIEFDGEGDLEESSVDPSDRGYLDGHRAFIEATGWSSIYIERPIYSAKWECGACPDDIGSFPGDPYHTVLDSKTGSVAYATRYQLAAYVRIANEDYYGGSRVILGRCALRLQGNGSYGYIKYHIRDLRKDTEKFEAALALPPTKKETP